MDPGEDHLSHTGGGQQLRVAPVCHQVPVPQVQRLLSSKKKIRNTFITRCRFGFPRPTQEIASMLTVDECMRLTHRKMYNHPRSAEEIRINNYNPLILMPWKGQHGSAVHRQIVAGHCTLRDGLRDQGREEQHAGPLAGGLLSLLRIQQAVLVRCTQLALQGVRSLRGQRSPSRRPPLWQVCSHQVGRCVSATEQKETADSKLVEIRPSLKRFLRQISSTTSNRF